MARIDFYRASLKLLRIRRRVRLQAIQSNDGKQVMIWQSSPLTEFRRNGFCSCLTTVSASSDLLAYTSLVVKTQRSQHEAKK
jgi:hypothetical protein